jgi:hypothetical protein
MYCFKLPISVGNATGRCLPDMARRIEEEEETERRRRKEREGTGKEAAVVEKAIQKRAKRGLGRLLAGRLACWPAYIHSVLTRARAWPPFFSLLARNTHICGFSSFVRSRVSIGSMQHEK